MSGNPTLAQPLASYSHSVLRLQVVVRQNARAGAADKQRATLIVPTTVVRRSGTATREPPTPSEASHLFSIRPTCSTKHTSGQSPPHFDLLGGLQPNGHSDALMITRRQAVRLVESSSASSTMTDATTPPHSSPHRTLNRLRQSRFCVKSRLEHRYYEDSGVARLPPAFRRARPSSESLHAEVARCLPSR